MYIAEWDFLKLIRKKYQEIFLIPLLLFKIVKIKQFNYLVQQLLTAKASSASVERMVSKFGLVQSKIQSKL
jgi:hypothetical protein